VEKRKPFVFFLKTSSLFSLLFRTMSSLTSTTRLSRAHQCLQWCSNRRKDIPASSSKDSSKFTFLESVTPFDHGVFDWGIGLKAARDLSNGEQLCSLPTRWAWSSLVATTDPILGPMLRKLDGKIRRDDLIAIQLAFHKSLGEDSPWHGHTQALPELYDSVLFWTKEELEELHGTNTFQLANSLQQQVAQDFEELRHLMWPEEEEGYHDDDDDDDDKEDVKVSSEFFTIDSYMWALGTLWSRGHDFVRGTGQMEHFRCMLPGIDLLNMATPEKEPNVEVRLVGNRVDLVAITANGCIKQGEELRVVYNKNLPNSRLLHLHGFIVSPNPLSHVQLHCDLSPQAPLYEEKIKILAGIETPHKLTMDDPVPETLLYTLALQRASTEAELRSLVEAKVTKSIGSGGSGFGSEVLLRELTLALTQMLGNYRTTEEVDEEILEEHINESEEVAATVSVGKRRLRLAVRLRYDEKKILRKSLSMLMVLLSSGNDDSSSSEDDDDDDIDD
jgi:hypothetical protein